MFDITIVIIGCLILAVIGLLILVEHKGQCEQAATEDALELAEQRIAEQQEYIEDLEKVRGTLWRMVASEQAKTQTAEFKAQVWRRLLRATEQELQSFDWGGGIRIEIEGADPLCDPLVCLPHAALNGRHE